MPNAVPMALNVTPAYGRHYQSASEALTAWEDGKDFKIKQGPYCSIRDTKFIKEKGFTHLTIDWQNNISTAVWVIVK